MQILFLSTRRSARCKMTLPFLCFVRLLNILAALLRGARVLVTGCHSSAVKTSTTLNCDWLCCSSGAKTPVQQQRCQPSFTGSASVASRSNSVLRWPSQRSGCLRHLHSTLTEQSNSEDAFLSLSIVRVRVSALSLPTESVSPGA